MLYSCAHMATVGVKGLTRGLSDFGEIYSQTAGPCTAVVGLESETQALFNHH